MNRSDQKFIWQMILLVMFILVALGGGGFFGKPTGGVPETAPRSTSAWPDQ